MAPLQVWAQQAHTVGEQSCTLLQPTCHWALRLRRTHPLHHHHTRPSLLLPSLQTRLTRARLLVNPQKTLKLSVLPKSEEDLECPKGADFYSLYWDDTPPDVRCFCCWGCFCSGGYAMSRVVDGRWHC